MQRDGAECRDAGLDIRLPRRGKRLGRRRVGLLVEVEAVDAHRHAAQLHHHVRALRQRTDRSRPPREHLVALAGIHPNAQRSADMVQADARLGKRQRKCGQFVDLRMVKPRIERQVQRCQTGKALTKRRIRHQAGRRRIGRVHQRRVGIPRRDVADAAKASAAGADMRFQHRPHALTQPQVGVAYDACAHLGLAVVARGAHRRDAVDEFGLTDRLHFLGTGGAMHRAALHEHGGDNVMPAVGVGQQIIQHIDPARPLPEMMVRIDDRQVGFQDRLAPPRQPVVADRQVGAAGRLRRGAHVGSSHVRQRFSRHLAPDRKAWQAGV